MDTLKWKACSRRPGEVSMNGRGMAPPTLLTTRSRRPKASRARSTRAATASRSLRSAGTATARRPAASTCSATVAQLLGGPGRDHHVGAGLGQADGGGRADAASGPGDDGHLVGHGEAVENHGSPSLGCSASSGGAPAPPRSVRGARRAPDQPAGSAAVTMRVGRKRTSSSAAPRRCPGRTRSVPRGVSRLPAPWPACRCGPAPRSTGHQLVVAHGVMGHGGLRYGREERGPVRPGGSGAGRACGGPTRRCARR